MKRKIEYKSEGRSGYVIYSDDNTRFSMYYEFGGGDCVAIVNIPSADDWVKVTGSPLSSRDEILTFIASQVVKDQTSKGHYRISGNFIEIYE
ncbi:MAG: hypothetical protein KDD00_11045 [Ignavibacteriae bacterium]|nr:hypothetical protein [Ignavibacteriota bacterium]